MSTLDAPIPLGVPLRDGISWVGTIASQSGTKEGHQAAQLCRELAASWSDGADATVQIPIVHMLCQILEPLRQRGEVEAVAKVEKIVQLLKAGQPRLIKASLGFNVANVNELDVKYETLRKQVGG